MTLNIKIFAFALCFYVFAILLFSGLCIGANHNFMDESDIDFTIYTLEELKNVRITSASKKPEKISELPAAVFVITKEDIQRSGATSIPEVLRMAPGVQVARISATEWAVNMRDLNQLFANKLLVLIDGRSIYTHAFSGVFWDIQDTILEDIERIEIIRGPGAALWGANAVNGVINIITKNAVKTQGTRFCALGGTEESIGSLRYGSSFGQLGHYRIYAKLLSRGRLFENGRDIRNDPSKGDWRSGRGGFRMDWETDNKNIFNVQGEAYFSQFRTETNTLSLISPYFSQAQETSRAKGAHILSKWQHRISDRSNTILQFYVDHYDKDFDGGSVRADTIDLDFQHTFMFLKYHEIIWGLNTRFITDKFEDNLSISTNPNKQNHYLYSAFIQDKIKLIPEYLNLTLGSKFENNDYTGMEIQPSARILWIPQKKHEIWAAISRAVRVPSRFEHDAVFNEMVLGPQFSDNKLPTMIRRLGNDNLDTESLTAYEIGYRFQPTDRLWFNLSTFYHDYNSLISINYDSTHKENKPVEHNVFIVEYNNNLEGRSYGAELSVLWQIYKNWKLQTSYTILDAKLNQSIENTDGKIENIFIDGSNPKNQISLRSVLDIKKNIELDFWLRYVDRLSKNDVDDYTTMDARLAWKPTKFLELSVVGQNLLEKRHSEYSSLEIERSIYFKAEWFF